MCVVYRLLWHSSPIFAGRSYLSFITLFSGSSCLRDRGQGRGDIARGLMQHVSLALNSAVTWSCHGHRKPWLYTDLPLCQWLCTRGTLIQATASSQSTWRSVVRWTQRRLLHSYCIGVTGHWQLCYLLLLAHRYSHCCNWVTEHWYIIASG